MELKRKQNKQPRIRRDWLPHGDGIGGEGHRGEQDVLFWGDKYSGVTVVMVTRQLYVKCILIQLQSILKLMRHTGKEALCCSLCLKTGTTERKFPADCSPAVPQLTRSPPRNLSNSYRLARGRQTDTLISENDLNALNRSTKHSEQRVNIELSQRTIKGYVITLLLSLQWS